MSNRETFTVTLAKHYATLFETPAYAISARLYTPDMMAKKFTEGLASGTANKDGDGIKRTCKELKIKHTYAAITEFLAR
jgi:hypothetical protein